MVRDRAARPRRWHRPHRRHCPRHPAAPGHAGAPRPARSRRLTPAPPRSHRTAESTDATDALATNASGKAAKLVIDGGLEVNGWSFGAERAMAGEVVFNTGMVGYPEALTDPSYRGQILVLTYPLVGNYGVPNTEDKDEYGLPAHFESEQIHIAGLVVASYSSEHSHWNSSQSLGQWLRDNNVPAIYGVDTRALTKQIREKGALLGKITFPGQDVDFTDPNGRNLVAEVSTKSVRVFGEGRSPRILAYDCGIKCNIIRYFVAHHDVQLTVVPFDYDLEANPENIEYDGLFISNGPGDPTMASATIKSLRYAIAAEPPKPIFGICLGNQLLSLAAGGRTYKMKYGNRGMNQPCVDLRTGKCYITPQNHGYAVDADSLPAGWQTFFLNANDLSNEGVIHNTKPFCSVQFHPEAAGGPLDTAFLFDKFVNQVRGGADPLAVLSPQIYHSTTTRVRKVLLVGSGGLSIGQAGEFDYSGSQAIKALKEEGVEVVLVNPNIATVQTSKGLGGASPDRVYSLPIRAEVVCDLLDKEKPDGIIVSMGGQTALNVGIELWEAGELQKRGIRVLGTQIPVIVATEDREIFSEKLREIGETLALSYPATSIDEAVEAAEKIGYPVLIRAAFALGGLGSGFAHNREELLDLAAKAFSCSSQILIDQDLRGWKEVEYEVVRDVRDNCITVCNMENFDPLGIHTGDSIVVAPSQTLSNREYFKLRATAIKVVKHLGVVGECNIQYALHPESERYCVIEVNARLSRSSALASKATGYPLAYVATKLSLGNDLVSIRNSVTKNTTACFEPSLDYCVVKMPRWDLKKFQRVSSDLGSSMKSVGEVMAMGRSFEECIQKAVRMVDPGSIGLEGKMTEMTDEELEEQMKNPTDERLWMVQTALERGYSVDSVHALTKIDRWFLSKLKNISNMKLSTAQRGDLQALGAPELRALKVAGFSDRQIAAYTASDELTVRRKRTGLGIVPYTKQVDTLAAEFPAATNYLYVTYSGSEHDLQPEQERKGVLVLGCGAYCIGSSVEFDWCAVSCVRELRKLGYAAIVVNYNPETVSTDFDESDRLFFEELSLERVLDIYEQECAFGVVVSVGGQIPNNLANPLSECGVNILGTKPQDIERAEDRNLFSAMLDSIGVEQPPWAALSSMDEALQWADREGFPVLVRPSFVLSGAAMKVASTPDQLSSFLSLAADVSGDKPVVMSKFILNAKEIEFDAVAANGKILNYAISEHVENAGVHSGDATLVLPAQRLYVQTIRQVKRIASKIAEALRISGPFNIQMLAKDNYVKVIECNLRASRTFPFISKTLSANFIQLATRVMVDAPAKPYQISLLDIDYVGVKAPMFSFTRLRGADPTLGVEMASTGEVACFGSDVKEAFLNAIMSAGFKIPQAGKTVLVSIANDGFRTEFLPSVRELQELGFVIKCSPGTASFYSDRGIKVQSLEKPPAQGPGSCMHAITSGEVGLVINVPEGTTRGEEVTSGYLLRRCAVDFGVNLITNIKCAMLLAASLSSHCKIPLMSLEDFQGMS